jgi:hypothetical protein
VDRTPCIGAKITNDGYRPVKIEYWPTLLAELSDGKQTSYGGGYYENLSDDLPTVIQEGESIRIAWRSAEIWRMAIDNKWKGFLYVSVVDALGNEFRGAFSGVKFRRSPRWGKPAYTIETIVAPGVPAEDLASLAAPTNLPIAAAPRPAATPPTEPDP